MPPITQEISAYAVTSSWEVLPHSIRTEVSRAFLNWFGCALGGSGEDMVKRAWAAVAVTAGAAQSSVIGLDARTDMISAAFLNCLSSSALAFDDTHLATVTHPTGPVAAALLAYSETARLNGAQFLNALALGIELQCRMSNVLLMPPAKANVSLYITGVTGPIGVAAALGRASGFDERRMRWAIGHAATQGAGFRATHGAMSGLVVPAYAARTGMFAVQLASAGVECIDNVLEAPMGFVEIHSAGADLNHATRGLGKEFEMLANTYKPYPSGIVVHPVIDACREVATKIADSGTSVEEVALYVNPLTITLANRRQPQDMFQAMVSIHHWVAAVFVRGAAGIAELRQDAIDDPMMTAFRERVTANADPRLERDQARAEVVLTDGRVITSFIKHARGSLCRPMSDGELDRKFIGQSEMVFSAERSQKLLTSLRELAAEPDVGAAIRSQLNEH
jgi:2-methylcitrate dehydratase PrpD